MDVSLRDPEETVIETRAVFRTYRSYVKPEGLAASLRGFWDRKYVDKEALRPTTLSIPAGQIVGLIGSNGAGKTTLLKVLSGLVHPSGGEARVLGFEPWKRDADFLRQISLLLGQKNQLWWDLTPTDSFSLLIEIYDLDRAAARRRVQELAQLLDCESVLATQLRRLSLGERMKMELIGALIHQPRVLFLDEPTIGLDVVAQKSVRDFLARYVREQRPTVILTSHYMDDIAELADRLLLISKGELVFDGSLQKFMEGFERKKVIHFVLPEALNRPLTVEGVELVPGSTDYAVPVQQKDLPQALAKIAALQGVRDLWIEETDFEDVIHEVLAQK